MYRIINCEQGTKEWHIARAGNITASNFSSIVTSKGALSSSSKKVINMAVAELLLGNQQETFKSEAMERGSELEDDALDFFNFSYGYDFKKVGFIEALKEDFTGELVSAGFGCSPDAIDFENNIGIELKCPLAHTHIAYLANGELPKEYILQVQGSMMVTGFDKWVFGSYHPKIAGFHLVVERDQVIIDKLQKHIKECANQIQRRYLKIKDMGVIYGQENEQPS